MKKTTVILTVLCIFLITTTPSFAAVKFGNAPKAPSNGKDYVGKIVAATYFVEPGTNSQAILISTKADNKLNESNVADGITIEFTDNDIQMGMVLGTNIGKDAAVTFDTSYSINVVSVITDEFWVASKK